MAQCGFSGDRFNAPDARRYAAFRHNPEQTNIAGARHMRAAAQFARKTDVQHAHGVAYFSPNNATAPLRMASSYGIVRAFVGALRRISALTSASTRWICARFSGAE